MSVSTETLVQAVREAKKLAKPRRFKQSVELIVKLRDVDVRKPENRLDTIIFLPNPPSKHIKVAVFATGDLALKAKDAGADLVLSREDIEKLAASKKDVKKLASSVDFFLAQADLMPLIGRYLGRYLGPRGKMPVPVPPAADIGAMISRYRSAVKIRMRDQPQVMCRIGTEDQKDEELAENAQAVLSTILSKFKPYNIEKVYVKLTMGPAVRVKLKGG